MIFDITGIDGLNLQKKGVYHGDITKAISKRFNISGEYLFRAPLNTHI